MLCSFFQSVEFYVIAAVVAAAVLGMCVKPGSKGSERTWLLRGILEPSTDQPGRVTMTCRADGNVEVRRTGIPGIGTDGAVSLAVSIIGQDVVLTERIVEGTDAVPGELTDVTFVLDMLGRDRYWVRYESPATELMCSAPLHNREGITVERELRR